MKQAIDSRKDQGQVIAAYVLTTADDISEKLKNALTNIKEEYKIEAECVILSKIKTIITKAMMLASISNWSESSLYKNT